MKFNLKTSQWVFLLTLFILIFGNTNIARWNTTKVIDWDIVGFYAYLPATFVYHDYKLNFTRGQPQLATDHKFWPHSCPNGGLVIKPTMGLALLYAPFFFLAHLHSQVIGLPPDGFSYYYHMYVHWSALFYLIIGLVFLRKLLLQWFSEWSVALCILATVVGTNLFYYASSEAAMSHAYNFSISALFLFAIVKWHESFQMKFLITAGICLGLLTLIRPINILFGIIPLFYGMYHFSDFKGRIDFIKVRWGALVIFLITCSIPILPQLLYWKSVTGQFIFYSYFDEHFFFLKPALWKGLLGFRNGWLMYTPLMFFALAGLMMKWQNDNPIIFALRVFIPVYLYVVLSWWCWWYVGFGNRAMVDAYAVLSIPLAYTIERLLKATPQYKLTFVSILLALIAFNQFQTLQYRKGLIHFDGMNFEAYRASFGTLKFSDAYKNALHSPDYEKAKLGLE